MNNEGLISRLHNLEDSFTERKTDAASRSELRKTLVAFANSVPEGRTAAFFIGVSDGGELLGVKSPDKKQKDIRRICEEDCYPSIEFASEVLSIGNCHIVAVEVPYSPNRPHFSGPAYVRVGSETVKASEEQFEELILSRIDPLREILKWKDAKITVITRGKKLGDTKKLGVADYRTRSECSVMECTAHHVRLFSHDENRKVTEPVRNVTVSWDDEHDRPMLLVEEA